MVHKYAESVNRISLPLARIHSMLERSSEICQATHMTRPKKPVEPDRLAKLLLDMASGDASLETTVDGKNPAAVALGRKGGLVGGKARAQALSARERSEISRKAAKARWKKKNDR
jgi:hypothetical protein